MCRRVIALMLFLSFGSAGAEGLSFEEALREAERQAPDLKAAEARRGGAAEAVEAADALPDPRAFVGVENLPVEGADRFRLERDFMTMQTIGVMQEFPNGAKRQARAAMAEAEVAAAETDLALLRRTLRREAAIAWLNRFYLEKQRDVVAALLADNRILQQAAEAQVRAGRRAADALLPRQERLALLTRQDEIERDIAVADARLRRWTGREAVTALEGRPPSLPLAPERWRDHVRHHPDLLRLQTEKDRARAALQEEQASLRPDWGVELAYQQRGETFGDMMSLQVSADLPLFSRSRQTPRIRARQQQLDSLEAKQAAMLREHQAALDADLATLTALDRQRERLASEALPLADEKISLELAAYRHGTGELSRVVEARQAWRELKLQQLAVEAQYHTQAANLHYLFDIQENRP